MDSELKSRLPLATQILAMQLAIVLLAAGAGLGAAIWQARHELDAQFEERALVIAESVASMDEVQAALVAGDPGHGIQATAESVRRSTGASYVVVTDRRGIRYSHPNPSLIGQPVDENPAPVLAGRTWVGVQQGTLGVAARGKAPIRNAGGQVIGMVSVGFPESRVSARLLTELPGYATTVLIALALGALGSILLAARVKRVTFGLEPHQIAGLLQEREATLQRISEGALATDRDGRITLVNDAAKRLLELDDSAVGRKLGQLLPPGRLLAFLSGQLNDADEVVMVGGRALVASRRPVSLRDRELGFVTTFRDATELARIAPRVGITGLTDALRAQAHEFSNRLHTIAGLVELGRGEEAMELIAQTSAVQQELTEAIVARVGDPVLAALLLAKAAVAGERGIELQVTEASSTGGVLDHDDLITLLGNLIDNAMEAVAGRPGAAVEVAVGVHEDALVLRVRDNGPGIPEDLLDEVFREGFSTKRRPGGRRRGFGLTLIRGTAERVGGSVHVENRDGAVFTVRIPVPARSRQAAIPA